MGNPYREHAPKASLLLVLAIAGTAHGQEARDPSPVLSMPLAQNFAQDVEARKQSGVRVESEAKPEKKDPGEKLYLRPALEIVAFDVLVNLSNRVLSGSDDYDNSLNSIRKNLRSSWNVDHDPFSTNQLAHPYQGSMYHTFARSSGLNFWESSAYAFGGSALWEIAGERTRPSVNDQIASGIGGAFFGEVLFRMANLVLEKPDMSPFWRELSAAAISPATGINRLKMFGGPRTYDISGNKAEFYSRLNVGVSQSTEDDAGLSARAPKRTEGLIDFAIDYGLPGVKDYDYRKPFDQFSFQFTATTANGIENVLTRGSLFARPYPNNGDPTKSVRGVYGLYASYDYIAPQTFRVSSTALSLGTTAQWLATRKLTFQGTAQLGLGYAAAGTVNSRDDMDYHYGVAPQTLLGFRVIYGGDWSFDVNAREYYVSRLAAADRGGHENIVRADASLTKRLSGRSAVSVRYLGNKRYVSYPDNGIGSRTQSRSTIGIFYTYLGHDGLGVVGEKY